ncbi:MAG: class I SAM-dependent methyltransferase, partial [Parachlamydiaceae bacterium]
MKSMILILGFLIQSHCLMACEESEPISEGVLLPQSAEEQWQDCEKWALDRLERLPGWCTKEKALFMMNLIKKERLQTCVEIGVFGGASLFPIAKSLQYMGLGKVWGIDAWEPTIATHGFHPAFQRVDLEWWSKLDYEALYSQVRNFIEEENLQQVCSLLKMPAEIAVHLFKDESIDFIHFDGNHTPEYALQEVLAYFPKVKDGGYILLNDAFWLSLRPSLVYLTERTEALTLLHPTSSYTLFRKSNQRLEEVKGLFKERNEPHSI